MTPLDPGRWVPFLWPEDWTTERPALVDLVTTGTPINCVVFRHSVGGGAELSRRGLLCGMLADDDSSLSFPDTLSVPVRDRGKMDWSDPGSILAVRNCAWPNVATRAGNDSNEAGPTGLPWIDSNGWFIQLARARMPGKPLWIHAPPPADRNVLRPSAYAVAVADAEAYGARWIVSLDRALSRGILAGNAEAGKTWDSLLRVLRYYHGRTGGETLPPHALLAALSDFSAANESLTHEFLNLIAREYVPAHVLLKQTARQPTVPAGVRMVVYLDPEPIPEPWKPVLAAFLKAGGSLLAVPGAFPSLGTPTAPIDPLEYDYRSYGRGRLILARSGFDDPWRLAADAHLLLGRRHDLVRLANAGSCNVSFSAASDGRRAQLRIVNYAGRPGINPVTVTLLHPYRSARLHTLEHPAPVQLPIHKESGRTALYLPEFPVYAEINLEM